MNKREEGHFVMERIERAFTSVDWINSYPNYAFRNLPIIRSNHGPIVTLISNTLAIGDALDLSICGHPILWARMQ